jgi:hypothetical protein
VTLEQSVLGIGRDADIVVGEGAPELLDIGEDLVLDLLHAVDHGALSGFSARARP